MKRHKVRVNLGSQKCDQERVGVSEHEGGHKKWH